MTQTPAHQDQWLRLSGIEPIISPNHQAWLHLDADDPLHIQDFERLAGLDPLFANAKPALRDAEQAFVSTADGLSMLVTRGGNFVVAEIGIPT